MRNRIIVFVAIIVFALALAGCAAPPTAKISRIPEVHTASSCASPLGWVILFGDTTQQCVHQKKSQPLSGGGSTFPQLLSPVARGVDRVCASHVGVWVAYASYEDPLRTAVATGGTGGLSLWIPANTCQTVRSALGFSTIDVTSVWFNPFQGQSTGPSSPGLLHQISPSMCEHRRDFFEVWYEGGKQQACYANKGLLQLPSPLPLVTRICSGANTGEVNGGSPLSGFSLSVDQFNVCASPQDYLGEATITVTQIGIYALS